MMSSPPTAREFGASVRKSVKDVPGIVRVRASTTSFAGFGYGSGIFATVECETRQPEEVLDRLRDIRAAFEARAQDGDHFIIQLQGPAYPFGGRP
jgi:hypothetical protein